MMPTNVAQTSLETYRQTPARELQRREIEVMQAIESAPDGLTREQCANSLGWKESAVCGRANALVAAGRLIESGERKTSSGRFAKILRLPQIQQGLFN
jgi:predicted transcriptional regulator